MRGSAEDDIVCDFETWLSPVEANLRARPVFGIDAPYLILVHLSAGRLKARARLLVAESGKKMTRCEYAPIPPIVWKAFARSPASTRARFWKSSDAVVETHSDATGIVKYGLVDIRVDPADFQALLGWEPPQSQSVGAEGESRESQIDKMSRAIGRPSKAFWDDLWLEMFRQLWQGEFNPKNQADIEQAMLDWAVMNGYRLGRTSVKAPAKKLFRIHAKR